ncbi:inositol monophosphatase family protein [Jeotgalibacillus campisalis]|uniref:Inositol monophosphatase/fructose-1,6-bisphosphatase family protein n=1 Tax=Jeotgalibacillus campisalis TaxID=220754 RepID=A0A0C2VQF5_9BACL|nr:inositol monophosphatase [Jeotgalibacillus campisalis]KIL51137.1 inositol monophosphatase/fructose-1,6-bisphosphatase family protein [Jeotgalibacillus campisalis]
MRTLLIDAKKVAEQAVREAGASIKSLFDQAIQIHEKDEFGDLVTEADFLAEKIIVEKIGKVFPDHQIHSEEAGDNGLESDWLWQIDPLDGTNNFAMGFPVFSASVALLYKREPVLGVTYEPMADRLYTAVLGEGTLCNEKRIEMNRKPDMSRLTVAWIQGHQVQNEEKAVKLRHYIDVTCKRMIRLWAPTLQWAMLAKGDIDGIVLYNSEGDDLYGGLLMVKEAGGIIFDFSGKEFQGMNSEPYLIACHPEQKEAFLKLVQDGLRGFNAQ